MFARSLIAGGSGGANRRVWRGRVFTQWPAMAVTIAAAWLVASRHPRRRRTGFYSFLLSNVLWVAWGWSDGAYALIALQCCLAVSNVRGLNKNAGVPQ